MADVLLTLFVWAFLFALALAAFVVLPFLLR